LVETALAARGLAVRQNRRRPLLPPSGHAPPWELVSASDLWWRRGYAGSNSAPCFQHGEHDDGESARERNPCLAHMLGHLRATGMMGRQQNDQAKLGQKIRPVTPEVAGSSPVSLAIPLAAMAFGKKL
jgi:hypothetical protein